MQDLPDTIGKRHIVKDDAAAIDIEITSFIKINNIALFTKD